MSTASIAQRLAELHPVGRKWRPPAARETFAAGHSAPPSTVDIEAEKAAAYRAGLADGRAAAEEAAALEQERARSAQAAQVEHQFAELGKLTAARVDAAIETMRGELAASATRLMRPVLGRVATAEALTALLAELRGCLPASPETSIRVQGPAALIDIVGATLQGWGRTVELRPADEIDVHIEFDQTLVETRIRSWLAAIEDVA